jgi:predicted small lipoprotein YifL
MKSPLLLTATAAALFALAACDNKPKTPEVVDINPDPMANELANRAPVELPPAIKADKSMRCQPGNVLLYVTFFEGDKLAMVRTEQNGPQTRLTAAKAGDPLTAEGGWKLTGTPTSAKITQPGKGEFTCKG